MANFSTRKGHCIYTRMSGIHSSSTDCKTKHQSTETTEPWQTPGELGGGGAPHIKGDARRLA